MRSWRSSPKNTGVRSLGGRASKRAAPLERPPRPVPCGFTHDIGSPLEAGYGKLSGLALRRADPKGLG